MMTQHDESPTILWPAPSPPTFGAGCPICGKAPGTVLEDGKTYLTVSADAFCSVEHRREWHFRDGCDRCRDIRPPSPDAPGWKIGGFTSYMDTEIVCPRCLVEWPKYEEYVAVLTATRLRAEEGIGQPLTDESCLQGKLLPDHFTVEKDGTIALSVGYDDGFYMTLGELEAAIERTKDFDVEQYRRLLAASEGRASELRARLTQVPEPKPYQRWLAGER